MAKKQPRECKKCDGGKRCHYCLTLFRIFGCARQFTLRKHGPIHGICTSCVE